MPYMFFLCLFSYDDDKSKTDGLEKKKLNATLARFQQYKRENLGAKIFL